jgi:fucose permease
MTAIPVTRFVRDRFTWLAYAMLAYFAYLQAALGPLMPFLRAELSLSYTVAGVHLSAFAVGMIVAGLIGDLLARKWGRRKLFWAGALGMAGGAGLLVLGQQAPVTVGAVLIMGLLGALLLVMIQASLSDRHGDQRAVALTEANVAAGVAGVFAPLAVGGFEQLGMSWRHALVAAVVLMVLAAMRFHQVPIPNIGLSDDLDDAKDSGPLPSIFWAYWCVLILVVSIEWCLVFWGADFLENVVGFPKATAATLMTVYWIAFVGGRFAGSRFARGFPAYRLLLVALAITIVGFPLFWLASPPLINLAGLFLVGLGIANLFPLTMSVALGVAPGLANATSARISLGSGLAILTVPLAVGWLADRITLRSAFAVEALLLLVATIIAWLIGRLVSQQAGGTADTKSADLSCPKGHR